MIYNFQKILIIHPGGIGDLIMLTPALKILRENFPDAKIDVFAAYTPEAGDVLKEGDIINRVFKFNLARNNLFNKLKFIYKLRKEKYDLSLLPTDVNHLKGGILSLLIGAKVKVGGRRENKKGLFYTYTFLFDEKKHIIETNISLLKTIGVNIEFLSSVPAPFLNFKEEKEFAEYFLAKNNLKNKILIGLHPNFTNQQKFKGFKRWPKEYFIELGKKILNNLPSVAILLLGGPDEKDVCLEIKTRLGGDAVIAAGYPLRQEAAIINKCRIFVGSDSGLTHVASTTETDLIAIFGPVDYRIVGPVGKKVHIINEKCDSPYDWRDRHFKRNDRGESCECLKKITPDIIFNKIKEILYENDYSKNN